MTTASTWDEVGARWVAEHDGSLWRAHSDAVNAALVRRWLSGAGGRLLKTDLFDEAVSAGLFPTLARCADAVEGVDVSPAVVRAASARHPALRALVADVRALPYAGASFDTVVSNSTLDHFPDRADVDVAVAELRRVLRPGGTLVLTLDNLANPAVALRNALPFALVHRLGLVPYYVGRTYSPRGARALLARHGFRVRAHTTVLHVPRAPAVLAAALVERWGGAGRRDALRARLAGWERLARWPTRALTGYFVAVLAERTGR